MSQILRRTFFQWAAAVFTCLGAAKVEAKPPAPSSITSLPDWLAWCEDQFANNYPFTRAVLVAGNRIAHAALPESHPMFPYVRTAVIDCLVYGNAFLAGRGDRGEFRRVRVPEISILYDPLVGELTYMHSKSRLCLYHVCHLRLHSTLAGRLNRGWGFPLISPSGKPPELYTVDDLVAAFDNEAMGTLKRHIFDRLVF